MSSLTLHTLESPRQRENFWQEFGGHSTWIVSDLRSQKDLQGHLLENRGYVLATEVMRAKNFWKLVFKQQFSDWSILPRALVFSYLKSHLVEEQITSKNWSTLQAILEELGPLFFQGTTANEWVLQEPDRRLRWGIWWDTAFNVFHLLSSKKLILENWLGPFLNVYVSSLSDPESLQKLSGFHNPLVFDLGPQLTQYEAELIRILAKHFDVHVLAPAIGGKKKQQSFGSCSFHLRAYDEILSWAQTQDSQSGESALAEVLQKWRLPNPLQEVEQAVAQVQNWMAQGIAPNRIAILAPRIEEYWPALSHFLKKFNLPAQKDVSASVSLLPSVLPFRAVLARCKDPLVYSELEADLALKNESVSFESMRSSLLNAQSWSDFFDSDKLNQQDLLTWDQALESLRAASAQSIDSRIAESLHRFTMNLPHQLQLTEANWFLAFLEHLDGEEIPIEKGNPSGVCILNIAEGDLLQTDHRIYLGLSVDGLSIGSRTPLSAEDLTSLAQEQGLSIANPQESLTEFELNWHLHEKSNNVILSFSEMNFKEEPQAPSEIWMCEYSGAKEVKEFERSQSAARFHQLSLSLHKTEKNFEGVQLPAWISPTSLQRYFDCPFQFFAEKGLGLTNAVEKDLLLDPRQTGSLVHAGLEQIFKNESASPNWPYAISEEEIFEILMQKQKRLGNSSFSSELTHLTLFRWAKILQQYLVEEKKLQSERPSRVFALEFAFDLEWEGLRLRGKIDRIDEFSDGSLRVIDYKTRSKDTYVLAKWFDHNEIQMALYAWVVQLLHPDRSIREAQYASLVDRKWQGYASEPLATQALPFQNEIEKKVKEFIQAKSDGSFFPKPRKADICTKCHWRDHCREAQA